MKLIEDYNGLRIYRSDTPDKGGKKIQGNVPESFFDVHLSRGQTKLSTLDLNRDLGDAPFKSEEGEGANE